MHTDNNHKLLNIALWIAQIMLAAFFLRAGFAKATMTVGSLAIALEWTKDVPLWLVRFIGICELLGSAGLLLPSILRIKPVLTPIAACSLIIVMILAILFHISRGEGSIIGLHFVIISIAAFIAWGRFKIVPLLPFSNGKNKHMII
jgi:uncharacterized membrane protein YphA (DoxX/SURF4 family)